MTTYEQLYWLTRLDGYIIVSIAIALIASATIVVILCGDAILVKPHTPPMPIEQPDSDGSDLLYTQRYGGTQTYQASMDDYRYNMKLYNESRALRKLLRLAVVLAMHGVLVFLFVPTQKQAILIYGGGAALDYVKKDSTLQQMPEKSIRYINALLDEKIEEVRK